jgi:copper chaperone CopZ
MTVATTILTVPDISCEHCERAITGALSPVAGVTSVNVDIPAKTVTVQYDPSAVTVDRFKEILAEEEYPVESVRE